MRKKREEPLLIRLCNKGYSQAVRRLLELGANPNAVSRDASGYTCTALLAACARGYAYAHGNASIVEDLLKFGADATQADDVKRTGLHFAAFTGNVAVLRLLLRAGAPVNVYTRIVLSLPSTKPA